MSKRNIQTPDLPSAVINASTRVYDARAYGYVGDNSTDDTTSLNNAIAAVEITGGILIIPPTSTGSYIAGTITINPINQAGAIKIISTGVQFNYSGTGDAVLVNTNESGSPNEYQYAQRQVTWEGLHVLGSSSAISGLHIKGCARAHFIDTCIENFTSTTSGHAAMLLETDVNHWVEECHFDGLEIRNTGHGICFLTDSGSGGYGGSLENNVYTSVHIWLTQSGGNGLYGVADGSGNVPLIARSVFNSIVIHPFNANNIIAFNLASTYAQATTFLSPAVDVYGTSTNLEVMVTPSLFVDAITVIGLNCSGVTPASWITGSQPVNIIGGNASNVGTLALSNVRGTGSGGSSHTIATFSDTGSANYLTLQNAGAGTSPSIFPAGSDTNISLSLYSKGTGQVISNATISALYGIDVGTVGYGLKVKEGSNAKQGTATLSSGSVVVSNTSVTATSRIFLTAQDNNSTGVLRVSARTAGTSFTITSSDASDNGVVAYEIFEQG
jgi:hypothetical protein